MSPSRDSTPSWVVPVPVSAIAASAPDASFTEAVADGATTELFAIDRDGRVLSGWPVWVPPNTAGLWDLVIGPRGLAYIALDSEVPEPLRSISQPIVVPPELLSKARSVLVTGSDRFVVTIGEPDANGGLLLVDGGGRPVWTYVGDFLDVSKRPLIDNGRIFAVTEDHRLVAIEAPVARPLAGP
jgi:hypothetical protein